MLKNIKTKIILMSVVIGLMILGSLSFLYLSSIREIQFIISGENNIFESVQRVNEVYVHSKISVIAII